MSKTKYNASENNSSSIERHQTDGDDPLASTDQVISQEIPPEVSEENSEKIVTVHYHPGSLCCLPDRYRFKDSIGNRWPVRILDCTVIGFGDGHSSGN